MRSEIQTLTVLKLRMNEENEIDSYELKEDEHYGQHERASTLMDRYEDDPHDDPVNILSVFQISPHCWLTSFSSGFHRVHSKPKTFDRLGAGVGGRGARTETDREAGGGRGEFVRDRTGCEFGSDWPAQALHQ